jgi:peptidoglycan/LPS O-acetylase OafA/YrhL
VLNLNFSTINPSLRKAAKRCSTFDYKNDDTKMVNIKLNITNKTFFIVGLVLFLIGQVILAKGNDFVYNQEPIDFAHWFLLIGVILLIPQTVSFPKSTVSLIGIPLTLVGIVCTIGMCVLDFIW